MAVVFAKGTLVDVRAPCAPRAHDPVAREASVAGADEASWSVGAGGIALHKNKGGNTGRQKLITTVLQNMNRLQ